MFTTGATERTPASPRAGVNVTRVRTGESPAQLLHDVPPATARHFLARVATAHVATPGVVVVMERDRLVVDSAAGGSTVYTISPVLSLPGPAQSPAPSRGEERRG